MKGITTYSEGFSIWQEKVRDVFDSRSNAKLWFSSCSICRDYVVCGLDTKRETLEYTREHMLEHL